MQTNIFWVCFPNLLKSQKLSPYQNLTAPNHFGGFASSQLCKCYLWGFNLLPGNLTLYSLIIQIEYYAMK